MRAELAKLKSNAQVGDEGVGTIGSWDVPQAMTERVSTTHQSMLQYVGYFAKAYAELIERIESSAKNFDLTDLAAQGAAREAGRGLGPRATHESQN